MKLWSVFSLIIVFHIAVLGVLLVQPGCQSQPADTPDPGMTTPTRSGDQAGQASLQAEGSTNLDPAFNAGITADASSSSVNRNLSAPRRPTVTTRSTPATGQLEPVLEPVRDDLTLPPVTREYAVQKGDSLTRIANREGISLQALISANGLNRNSTIYVGQKLLIPEVSGQSEGLEAEMEREGSTTVTVGRGDSLSAIASRSGTTVQAIKSLNQLKGDTIYVGQTLKVPGGAAIGNNTASTNLRSSPRSSSTSGLKTHTVKAGDTPSGIARQYGISSRELMTANNITDPRKLFVGMKLVIPGQSSGPTPPPETGATRASAQQPMARSSQPATSSLQNRPETPPSPAEENPLSALEALEDEDLPLVDVEILNEGTEPAN